MSDNRLEHRLKEAILALQHMRGQLEAVESAKTEALAIVGMACRFPGGSVNLETYWDLLVHGGDGMVEVPPERWDIDAYYDPNPDAAGKIYTRHGGFLDRIDHFDPLFFGISPREAEAMDPQQRLLLEVTWEALEQAGIAPDELQNSRTGVFVGVMNQEYGVYQTQSDPSRISLYTGTGNAASFAAGRLSYVFGLQGPCMPVDTACSSSLVAVHLASQSLRAGECDVAIVGGVNLMVSPEGFIYSCRLRALSPDGHCKTFDAAADGYARGEGCGIIILKRLSDARAQRHHMHAVIRGTAVNHDGPSGGLTVPNAAAQQAVIRDALANARARPEEISYVEVHGTGTALGDPIEVRALGAVLSVPRGAENPLYLTSVKANIGHLESAAGIAGLIKLALALQHRTIPPHRPVPQLNPHIHLDEHRMVIPSRPVSWMPPTGRCLAGVSSFGLSGINAHVIVEEAPAEDGDTSPIERPAHILCLSAATATACEQLRRQFLQYLTTHPEVSVADICDTANTGRVHFPYRLALVAETRADLQAGLARPVSASMGHLPESVNIAAIVPEPATISLRCGQELYATQPIFRRALETCDALYRRWFGRALPPWMDAARDGGVPNEMRTRAYAFALDYALATMWQSWGVGPQRVLGHDTASVLAACIAGELSVEQAMQQAIESGTGASTPVDIHRVIVSLLHEGYRVVIGLGPVPDDEAVLEAMGAYTDAIWLPSLTPDTPVWPRLLHHLARLYERGFPIDWHGFERPYHRRLIPLPSYPFERRRYWIEPPFPTTSAPRVARGSGEGIVAQYYDQLGAQVGLDRRDDVDPAAREDYITFAPFRQIVPGFSWLLTFYRPERVAHHARLAMTAQQEMRQVLFGAVDFASATHALDIGCGVASDVIRLARAHPHLVLDGYTLSRQQVDMGTRKLDALELTGRVHLYCRDSTREPFPHHYDVVFGLEVACHIADKNALFDNIARHLKDGAHLLLADFMSRTGAAIDHDETSSYLVPAETWSRVLADHHLRVVKCIDTGEAVANFLHDPDFDHHWAQLQQEVRLAPVVRQSVESYHNLSQLLRQGRATYVLLKAQRDRDRAPDALYAHNLWEIDAAVPYADTVGPDAELSLSVSDWFYRMSWRNLPRNRDVMQEFPQVKTAKGSWLLFADANGVGDAIAATIRSQGDTCIVVTPSETFQHHGADAFGIEVSQPAHMTRLLEAVHRHGATPVTRILHAWSLDLPDLEAEEPNALEHHVESGCRSVLHLIRALNAVPLNPSPQLWLLTREAVWTGSGQSHLRPIQAPLWGLARGIAAEYPGLWGGIIDVDTATPVPVLAHNLVEDFRSAGAEVYLAYRQQQRLVARLTRHSTPSEHLVPVPVRADGTYLIAGGLGGLGLQTAQWLVSQGARRLVLTARSPLPPRTSWAELTPSHPQYSSVAAVQALEAVGVTVRVAAADVADVGHMTAIRDELFREWPPLRGIVHAAGTGRPVSLLDLDAVTWAQDARAKVVGSIVLHRVFHEAPLDFFVLYASVSAILPSPWLGGYAAANAFQDALAHYRHLHHLPALSIDWGVWSQVGLAARHGREQKVPMPHGMGQIHPVQAQVAMSRLWRESSAQVVVMPVNWEAYRQAYPRTAAAPFFAELVDATPALETDSSRSPVAVEDLESTVVQIWQQVLKIPEVKREDNFFDLGGDSLLMVEIHAELTARLGRDLVLQELLRYPTIAALTQYLRHGREPNAIHQPTIDRAQLQRQALHQQRFGVRRGRS